MKISVALGSGGVRGFAHIGVLQGLQDNGFEIEALAGCSAGAVASAIFATGINFDDIIPELEKLKTSDFFSAEPTGQGFMGASGIRKFLTTYIGEDTTFADLKYPIALAAVDLKTGNDIMITKGNVIDAVLSSAAIPLVFPPIEFEGSLLVDGAIRIPLPSHFARKLRPDLPVVGVSLDPPFEQVEALKPSWFQDAIPLKRVFSRLRIMNALNVYSRVLDLQGYAITKECIEKYPPNVLLEPMKKEVDIISDFDVEEMVEDGKDEVDRMRVELLKAVSLKATLLRSSNLNPYYPYTKRKLFSN